MFSLRLSEEEVLTLAIKDVSDEERSVELIVKPGMRMSGGRRQAAIERVQGIEREWEKATIATWVMSRAETWVREVRARKQSALAQVDRDAAAAILADAVHWVDDLTSLQVLLGPFLRSNRTSQG
jgi:hypothetical protein